MESGEDSHNAVTMCVHIELRRMERGFVAYGTDTSTADEVSAEEVVVESVRRWWGKREAGG